MVPRGAMAITPISMPTKGFTLIEVLLVVVIVAILAGVIVMHMDLDQGRHVLHEGADQLAAQLANVEDEAVGRQEVWGVVVGVTGVQMYRLQTITGVWEQVQNRSWMPPRYDLPAGLRLRLLALKKKPVAASSDLSQGSSLTTTGMGAATGGGAGMGAEAIHPDLYFLPSGEVTSATLILETGHDSAEVVLDAIGHIDVREGAYAPAAS